MNAMDVCIKYKCLDSKVMFVGFVRMVKKVWMVVVRVCNRSFIEKDRVQRFHHSSLVICHS